MKELFKKTIYLGSNDLFAEIDAIGDSHLGNKFCDRQIFETNVKWEYDKPNNYVIMMGDIIECALKNSVGRDEQVMDVDDQWDEITALFGPIADQDRLLGYIKGNHENRSIKEASFDIAKRVAKDLHIPYFGDSTMLEIKVKMNGKKRCQKYSGYAKHGSSSATTPAGQLNAVLKMNNIANVEFYLMGHVHALMHQKQSIFEVERGRQILKQKHYIITGAYLEYGGYAEAKGYAPSGPCGSPKIKLHVDQHRISVSL